MDANSIDEVERRRKQFGQWLFKAWSWADEQNRIVLADRIAEIMTHVEEHDYPLWESAKREALIGEGALASKLRKVIGLPVQGPRATGWEREIHYSPIITLDEKVWRDIHGKLGWANRDADIKIAAPSFFLWSPQGNVVRFVMRQKTDAVEPNLES